MVRIRVNGADGRTVNCFLTADNKVICGYSLYKTDMSGNTAALEFWLNGKVVATKNFTPSSKDSDNPFNYGRGHQDVRKEGDKITFYWFGSYIPYVDSAVKDMICTKFRWRLHNILEEILGINMLRGIICAYCRFRR